jgi:hypothetical protein
VDVVLTGSMRTRLAARLVTLVAVSVTVFGNAACGTDGQETRARPVDKVVVRLGLGEDALSALERTCLEQAMKYEPPLAADVRETSTLEELEPWAQARVYELVLRCARIAVGRALVGAYESTADVAPGRTFVGNTQYRCLGGHVSAPSWIVDLQDSEQERVLTTDEMTAIVTVLYLCAQDYVVNGPLARSLHVSRATAACVATRLAGGTGPLPEVVRTMFGQGGQKRSAALAQLISACGG